MFTGTETDPLIAVEHTKRDIVKLLHESGFRPVRGQYELPPAAIETIATVSFACGRTFGVLEGGNHALASLDRQLEARQASDVSEQQHLRAIGAEQPQWSDA